MTSINALSTRTQLPDYYELLEVQPSASFKTILDSYQSHALKLHPDAHPADNVTSAAFNLVNEAYYVLSDTQRRSSYDQARLSSHSSNGTNNQLQSTLKSILGVNTNMMDVFNDVFEPLIATEMDELYAAENSGRGIWGVLGSVSGTILGFIFANVPGAAVGGVIGYKAGSVRDRTGRSVMDTFQNLTSDQRHTILTSLARKLIF